MKERDMDICAYPHCKRESALYVNVAGVLYPLCYDHWQKHCDESEKVLNWKTGEPNTEVEKALHRQRRFYV